MTRSRTKRENICDECGLPISICSAKAVFELAVSRNGREAVIAAILDVDKVMSGIPTAPDAVAHLIDAARAALNYLENTEGEFGITLGSATGLRAALAAMETTQ